MPVIEKSCPFCGPKPMVLREEGEEALSGPDRKAFIESICDNCWAAIMDGITHDSKPVNEAEQLDGLR